MEAEKAPPFLSSSIFNLLELIKAISIPEKKAENNSANKIIKYEYSPIRWMDNGLKVNKL